MAECNQWFWAKDQDGNYPYIKNPSFVLVNSSTGENIGYYEIPFSGLLLTLDTGTSYTVVPLLHVDDSDDWVSPPAEIDFHGCQQDIDVVWERKDNGIDMTTLALGAVAIAGAIIIFKELVSE